MRRLLLGLAMALGLTAGAAAQQYWDEFPAYWIETNGGQVLGGSIINSITFGFPAVFSVSGNPCTGGDCIITVDWASQPANCALASPDGAPGLLSCRTLVAADCPTCSAAGAPSTASFWTKVAEAGLSNEFALGSLGTGLVINTTTTGVPTILGAQTCTNQFVRSYNASGTATCASVVNADITNTTIDLTTKVTGVLPVANGGVPTLVYTYTLENPGAAENMTIGYSPSAITLTSVRYVLKGSASPSVTPNVQFGTDRSAAGTAVTTSPSAVTNVTTGATSTINNNAVSAGSYLWFVTTAQSGTVTDINVTITYTQP